MEEFNHWNAIADQFSKATSQVIRKTAFDVQAKAVATAPDDTSFLRNSMYVVTDKESTYDQCGEPVKKGQHLLPEIEKAENDQTAYIAIGAYYGVFVNYGTVKMSARPFLEPAIEAARPGFEAAMAAIESKLKEVS